MNYSPRLPGNPYEEVARVHQDPALATLALAYEIRTLIMLEHPHVKHENVTLRMKETTGGDQR